MNPWSIKNWGVRGHTIKGIYLGPRGRGGVKLSLETGIDVVLGSNCAAELAAAIRSGIGQSAPVAASA